MENRKVLWQIYQPCVQKIYLGDKNIIHFFHKIIVPGILIWIPCKNVAGISADPWPGWSPYVAHPAHRATLAAPLQCTQANHPVGYAKTQETSFTGEPKRSTPPKMVLGRNCPPHPAHTSWLKKSFFLRNDSTSHHIVTEYEKIATSSLQKPYLHFSDKQ